MGDGANLLMPPLEHATLLLSPLSETSPFAFGETMISNDATGGDEDERVCENDEWRARRAAFGFLLAALLHAVEVVA